MADRERPKNGESNPGEKTGRLAVWIPVTVFCILIFGGFLWALLKEDTAYSAVENRYLATKPKFSWESLWDGSFTGQYEEYVTDQFPARDQWIGLKTRAELGLGKKETKNVWLAEDGYLIVNYPALDFTGAQAQKNKQALAEALAYYTKELGAEHVRVMLVPTASQVLVEKLPEHSQPYDQSEYMAQVLETVQAVCGSDTDIRQIFVDAEGVLRAHDEEAIYYRTDHHWTTLGAYYGYQAWAQSMGQASAEKTEPEFQTVSENFLGTTYAKIHYAKQADEIQICGNLPEVTMLHNLTEESQGFYDWSALEKQDQYAFFLGGNDGLLEIVRADAQVQTPAGQGQVQAQAAQSGQGQNQTVQQLSARESAISDSHRVLLVVKDSYANCFVPYLAQDFERIVVVDLRYLNMSLRQLAEQYQVTDLLVLYNVQSFATELSVFKISR